MHLDLKNQFFQWGAKYLRQLVFQHLIIMPLGIQPKTVAWLNPKQKRTLKFFIYSIDTHYNRIPDTHAANISHSAKLWWWQTLANLENYLSIAKYNPPNYKKLCTMIHVVLVLPKFNLPKFPCRLIHQSLAPTNFNAVQYSDANEM